MMNTKLFILLAFFSTILTVEGQRPFMPIKAGSEWFVEIHCYPEQGESQCNWTVNCNKYFLSEEDTTFLYTVTMVGDTLWYEKPYIYNKLYAYNPDSTVRMCQYSGYCSNSTCQPDIQGFCSSGWPNTQGLDYIGGIRQDTANKKLYYKPDCNFYKDTLLYDFSLELGDTAFAANNYQQNVCESFGGLYWIVTNIDSVLLEDGIYHWRWWFGNTMKVIEGVGSDNGFVTREAGVCMPYYCKLVSNHNLITNDTLYKDPTTCSYPNRCNLTTAIPEHLFKSPIKIYPNPASDFISIELPQNYTQAQLSVYNLTGQLVSHKHLTQSSQQIPIHELGNGMYIFVIQNRDEIIGRLRVVIAK